MSMSSNQCRVSEGSPGLSHNPKPPCPSKLPALHSTHLLLLFICRQQPAGFCPSRALTTLQVGLPAPSPPPLISALKTNVFTHPAQVCPQDCLRCSADACWAWTVTVDS